MLFACLAASACTKDFIEKDLSKKHITVLAPPNGYSTTTNSITFWWEETEGANEYNIQIVKPSFSWVQLLVCDTMVEGTKFTYTLVPGTYQWRIRCLNGSSDGPFTTLDLTVDSTANISGQTLVLKSPAANYFTKTVTNTFKWDTLYNAADYRFQVINLQNSATVTDITTQADSFSYTLAEGQYKWQVRGQNATSNTLYSSRNITIDLTPPTVSTLLLPTHKDTVSSPDTLTWSRNSSAMADSLFIYPDSLISSPQVQIYTLNTSYIFSSGNGDYFWRLKSRDQAGNWSSWSTLRKFWIQ